MKTQSTFLNKKILTSMALSALMLSSYAFAEIKYPIVTKNMTPAINKSLDNMTWVESNKPDELAPRVIVFLGDDPISLNWFNKTKKHLSKSKRDFYLIVNVSSKESFEKIKKMLPAGVNVIPMNADVIAKRYNLKHYPDFIGIDEDRSQDDEKTVNELLKKLKQYHLALMSLQIEQMKADAKIFNEQTNKLSQ